MNFGLTFEQEMIVDTVREFVEKEIYPHEGEVEKSGEVPLELGHEIRDKCIEAGYFAANIAEEFGGGGARAPGLHPARTRTGPSLQCTRGILRSALGHTDGL